MKNLFLALLIVLQALCFDAHAAEVHKNSCLDGNIYTSVQIPYKLRCTIKVSGQASVVQSGPGVAEGEGYFGTDVPDITGTFQRADGSNWVYAVSAAGVVEDGAFGGVSYRGGSNQNVCISEAAIDSTQINVFVLTAQAAANPLSWQGPTLGCIGNPNGGGVGPQVQNAYENCPIEGATDGSRGAMVVLKSLSSKMDLNQSSTYVSLGSDFEITCLFESF